MPFDRGRLSALLAREAEAFAAARPRSRALFERAGGSLLGGVPMPWMMRWAGGFPVFAAEAPARGSSTSTATSTSTSASATRARCPATARPRWSRRCASSSRAGSRRCCRPRTRSGRRGAHAPLRAGALAVHADRHRRQPRRAAARPPAHRAAPRCSCSATATTAPSTRRSPSPGDDGGTHSREGNVGPPVDPAQTTRAVEFNDLEALEAALAGRARRLRAGRAGDDEHGDRPPGARLPRAAARAHARAGTLLIIDETHTFSAGPGGCTAAWGLEPDLLTIGKAIGSGIPSGRARALGAAGRRAARRPRRRLRGHRRRRRHAGRQRAVGGGDARDARARAHRGGVRAHGAAGRALRGRRAGA